MDLLVVWGVAQAAGFVFKPILEELSKDLAAVAKDAAKDWTKDLFKGIPGNALKRLQKQDIDIAAGKALKEFLLLVQQELEDAVEDEKLKQFVKPFKTFIHNKDVKEILGSAFKYECETLDTKTLESKWYELDLSALPAEFDWKRVGKRYLKKVKAIIRDTDELRVILDSQNIEAIKENTQATAGIIPDFDLIGYQEAIKETYGKLKLESLDTSGYAYNQMKLWGMFIAQNVREVHELPQHELPKHLKRLRETQQAEAEDLELFKRIYLEQPIHSVLEIINEKQTYKYIVILGDPGSGKSTLLQYLALNWAESPLNSSITQPIPLLIELCIYMRGRDEKECNNFLEFFHKCSGAVHHLNQHQLQTQLKAGNALVMFDGLDEVFDDGKRIDVIRSIRRFTNEYPNVQVIVTSRVVIGYKLQILRDAEFKHFELQDLETKQIQDFIYRWHELTFNDEADKIRKKERLQKGIENSKAIRELAGNPLLLTMMAILNRNQELPRDRAELYNQASRVLLHQWDVERALVEDKRLDPKTIDYKDKQAMLRQVAYFMQTSEKGKNGNLIKESDLERILKDYLKTIEADKPIQAARLMINQLRSRNFMLCDLGADYYAFVHRTFLEYFCAWEFVWQFKETQTLSIEQLKTEVFGKHWMDQYWHEVLRLIAGMIEAKFVGQIIEFLMGIDGEDEEFKNLFLAADCLGEVRNRKVIEEIDTRLYRRIIILIHYNDYYLIHGKNKRDTIFEINKKGVETIGTVWDRHPRTFTMLKELAIKGHNDVVQYHAVITIANSLKNDSKNLSWLKNIPIENGDDVSTIAALEGVARYFQEDLTILPWLKNIASNSISDFIRCYAIQVLARNFKTDSDTLDFLKQCIQLDECWNVRCKALEELANNCKDEPSIFEFFCDIALNDPFKPVVCEDELVKVEYLETNPRQTALEAIIKYYPNHPKTLPLLQNKAKNDPDEQLREFAQKKLQEWNQK
jgi:predicted NACHT family NTPase